MGYVEHTVAWTAIRGEQHSGDIQRLALDPHLEGRRCQDVVEQHGQLKAVFLGEEGIDIEVVDPRTLVPLDKETLVASARKTGKVLIVHEAVQTGGFGGEIYAVIGESEAFYYLDAPIKRLCGLDVPIPYCLELEREVVPTADSITQAVYQLMR